MRGLYEQEMRGGYSGIDPADFANRLGVPQRQVEVALKYLVDVGLLKGEYVISSDVPLIAGITASGIDFVENPKRLGGGYDVNQQIIQVTGPVYAPIAQAQGGSQISQVVDSFRDVELAIDAHTEVPEPERAVLKERLRKLEQALRQDQISKSRLSGILQHLKKYAWLYPLIIQLLIKILES